MSKALYGPTAGLPVIMIGVMMMMMSLGVSAQPTVADDDEAYCQSGTFEGFVSQFGADIKTSARDVQQIKEQLSEVKNLLESRQQPCQCSDSDTSTLCECKTRSLLICKHSSISDWGLAGYREWPERNHVNVVSDNLGSLCV